MKFLCLGYFDPTKMQALSRPAVEAAMQDCPRHMDTLQATGKLALVAGADNDVRYLQLAGGQLDVRDHAEEAPSSQIGCVFVVEAATMDEAVRLASLHPTTQIADGEHLGWRTEVRPIHTWYGDKDSLPGPAA